ncbi:MAG: type I 3-dehydroquinate dehydratase [Planctomycetota bacterium]|nr:type I 3-dehydroquinate dehydratase [Planctomycetota bacterium]
MTQVVVPLGDAEPAALLARAARARQLGADLLELRLDLALAAGARAADLLAVLPQLPLPAIVTVRHQREGGRWQDDERARLRLYEEAEARGAAWIDRELAAQREHPWRPTRARLLLSYHAWSGAGQALPEVVAAMRAAGADLAKLAVLVRDAAELAALRALHDRRGPVAAMAMGEAGLPSRVLAGVWGAALVYARLPEDPGTAPGQPALDELLTLYRLRAQRPETAVYGVIGAPIAHSLSPLVHNLGFAHHGIDAVYAPFLVHDARAFWQACGDWFGGLSVTVPHKQTLAALLAECEPEAAPIGAINTVYRRADRCCGANTDAEAVRRCCERALGGSLHGRCALVLGAGGAARAAVHALRAAGARVLIANRTPQRAAELAAEFAATVVPLAQAATAPYDILINATTVGLRAPDDTPWPHPLRPEALVFDMVYDPLDTGLLRRARAAGCSVVSGLDMFLEQASGQFRRWTGRELPMAEARAACLARLAQRSV